MSGSTIVLKIPTEGGRYDPIGFSNMKNMELVLPSKNCKPWRYGRSGLNLPGICKYKNC